MTQAWKSFWDGYRNQEARSEADLFKQVGRTVNGEPISAEEFRLGVRHAADRLKLRPDDVLFEHCCGNGLICYELAALVQHVVGVDFAEHLIGAAKQWRRRPNIEYHVGNALEPLGRFVGARRPTKFLMSYALAHFSPRDLAVILRNAIDLLPDGEFAFLFTGIPDDEKKWSFYNTPERRARYLDNQTSGSITNDGMGRWWKPSEITAVARELGLEALVEPEPAGLTNYRMDALLSRRS